VTVIVTAVFHPAEGLRDQAVEALRATIPAVHAEQGCELYAIHDAEDGTIVMIERWTTAEDLDRHGSGPAVAALGAAVTPFLAGPTVVTRMTALPAGVDAQGVL
jgi:quinol monooxygenase YgiN